MCLYVFPIKRKWNFKMDKKIENLLKKVLPKLMQNPEIMEGYDIVGEEIDYILENNKFPFEWLKEVAWDNFFECCYDEIGINYKQALRLRHYLVYEAKKELDKLKELFPFLE